MPDISQIVGKYQIVTVTYAEPRIIETSELLPTTTPGAPQIEFTIEASDIPIIDALNTPTYHAIVYAFGTAPEQEFFGRTITYTGYINAVEATTFDIDIPAVGLWSAVGIFSDVEAGDVLTVELTSLNEVSTLDKYVLAIFIDSFQVAPAGPVAQITYSLGQFPDLPFASVDLPIGLEDITTIGPFHVAHGGLAASLTASTTLSIVDMESPYYVGRVHFGGYTAESFGVAGDEWFYACNIVPFGVLFYTVGDIGSLPDDLKGVERTYTITHQPVVEVLEGTPAAIPTSLPGSPQYTYTVDDADFPEVTPPFMRTPMYHLLIALGGHNGSGSGRILTCEIRKNGTVTETPTGTVSGGAYWSLGAFVPDVRDGDVITIFIYAENTGVVFDRHARSIAVDDLQLAPTDRVLTGVEYITDTYPVLTIGAPSLDATGPLSISHLNLTAEITGDTSLTSQVQRSSLGAGVVYYGHRVQLSEVWEHATASPQYVNNTVLASVTFRLTDITVQQEGL